MPPRAERKNATRATPSRTEEHRVCRAGQNVGPPHTPGRARQNGTPMPRRAERKPTAHTGPRQTERNTAAHTGPRQTERKTSAYATDGKIRGEAGNYAAITGWFTLFDLKGAYDLIVGKNWHSTTRHMVDSNNVLHLLDEEHWADGHVAFVPRLALKGLRPQQGRY